MVRASGNARRSVVQVHLRQRLTILFFILRVIKRFVFRIRPHVSAASFIIIYNYKTFTQALREYRLFFIEILNPKIFTIMKQNKRDFLEAIGFEGNEKDMLKQMAFGIGVGLVMILFLGLAELIGEWIGG